MLPTVVAVSTSPSLAKTPPAIETVAADRVELCGSETVRLPDSVAELPFSVKCAFAATLLKVGAGTRSMVVVAAVLRLFEALPSLHTQVTVRVGWEPLLVGLLPDAKVTESSTDW